MFRREWRQQLLVLSLVTIAVATSVAFSTVAMNAAGTSQPEFGTGGAMAQIDASAADEARAAVATARRRFGDVEVIGHTAVRLPGYPTPLDVRAQAPGGRFGRPLLALRDGRYPTAPDEVALTSGAADRLHAEVGDEIELGGSTRHVVGLVENPSKLDDDFALVAPGAWRSSTKLTLLFEGPGQAGTSTDRGTPPPAGERTADAPIPVMVRGDNGPVAALVLVAVTLAMTLVGLVTAAGFVVVAQRRQRQLGLLAAIGATSRHLRMVVIANGVIVGVIAAVVGGLLGVLGWILASPVAERAFGHRIGRFDLPWGVIACCLALAVAMAVAAAWWPARRVSRLPVIAALSGRPPEPTPVHRSSIVAAVLLVGGVAAIATALPPGEKVRPLLLVAGIIAVAIGTVFVAPVAVRAAALPAGRLPFTTRLAVRDLARFQGRAASALAAIAFAIGMSVTVVALAQAHQYGPDEGNLPANQMLIRADGDPNAPGSTLSQEEADRLDAEAAAVAAEIPGSTTLGLDVAIPSTSTAGDGPPVEPVSAARKVGPHTWNGMGLTPVATSELLRHYDIRPDSISADTDLLTSDDRRGVMLLDISARDRDPGPTATQHVDLPDFLSGPHALITEGALERHGWTQARSGWLIETPSPLTPGQISAARAAAATAGLTIETRNSQSALATFRTVVGVLGTLLGLAIVAMTVGLIRTESARDVRTLTATGASSRSRRAITASTAGTLAALGALLGTAGAYAALLAGYHASPGELLPAPWVPLLVLVVGLPVLATAAGWLLAGRDPRTFARQTFD